MGDDQLIETDLHSFNDNKIWFKNKMRNQNKLKTSLTKKREKMNLKAKVINHEDSWLYNHEIKKNRVHHF